MSADRRVPSDEVLLAFERGLLPDAEFEVVARWLETDPQAEARMQRLTGGPEEAVEALRQPCPLGEEISRLSGLTSRVVARVLAGERPAPEQDADPVAVRDYQILRALGQGGMGRVYLARHARLRREVALKILPARLAADPWYRGRFEREMAVLGQLEHPNLVRAHDAGAEGAVLFLAMELLDGQDLRQLAERVGPLPVADACEAIRQAALGLHHAHEHGLVHRDIKPGNLFLTRPGAVKVIDLGLARVLAPELVGEKLSSVRTVLGTPDYMAPEQWDTAEVDRRADLYGLGCALHFLLTGQPPFGSVAHGSWGDLVAAHKLKAPPSLHDHRRDVPEALARLVARLLAKRPNQRPATALEVAAALGPLAGGHRLASLLSEPEATLRLSPAATPRRSHAPSTRRRRFGRYPMWLAVGAVVVAAVVWGASRWWPATPRDEPAPAVAAALPDRYSNSLGMEFVRVPAGTAWLGGGGGVPGDREVTVRADFYLGRYEVTQEEWRRVMGSSPSHFGRAGANKAAVEGIDDDALRRFPVETVSWVDAQRFLEKLNQIDAAAGWTYRLPTVVEWEYACRNGPMADRAAGAASFHLERPTNQMLPEQANFQHEKGLARPCRVGSFGPNRLGLCDMYGNVYEWTEDAGRRDNLSVGRVLRGGAYWMRADQLNSGVVLNPQSGYRDVGFRVARVPVSRSDPRRGDFDAWRKEVAALPAERQVEAVADLLRLRNPSFHDKVTGRVAGGAVTELAFLTDNATDLEPVRALPGLRVLRCAGVGGGRGQLADLGPLKGLPLTHLDCRRSLVSDLTPLVGMPLHSLNCDTALVTDLSPLRGLPLRVLTCDFAGPRDAPILRAIPTLERVNDQPAKGFLANEGAGK